MTKVTLNNVGSLIEATTAATTINNNFDTIETAFDNTLSRNGTSPNTMGASLDMNSNNIINLPVATVAGEPVTFEVFEAALTGAGNLPSGGTTGQVLAKVSNVSYDTAWTSESAELTAGTNISITGGSPATISTVAHPTFASPNITTPVGIVKGDVGLGNVDNTSDATKNAASVTLTNKTIAGASNTLTARIGNDVSGLGTGVATALGVNVGSAGAPVLFNGAGGTPSSIVLTNATGTAGSLTVGAATSAQNTQISNDTTTNATMFPTWVNANSGNLTQQVSSTKLTFNPSTGVLSSTSFTGAGTGLTGTAASLTSGAVTTNANLTGDVTSVGNATTLTNAPVIAKVLTGYTSGAGTVSASDSILSAIQKLNGNDATNANLTGVVTSVGNATSLGSFTSANLRSALTDEVGTGAAYFVGGASVLQTTPAAPTGTGSATAVMMGLGSTCTLTPTASTRVFVQFIGCSSATIASGGVIQCKFGTGTAPANGVATTGTDVGTTATSTFTLGNEKIPFTAGGIITGLSIGTAYWFDLSMLAGGGTVSINSVSCSAHEIP